MTIAIVIPESWLGEVSNYLARWEAIPSSYFFISVSEEVWQNPKKGTELVLIQSQEKKAQIVLWILPIYMTKGQCTGKWPEMINTETSKPLVNSLCFADSWKEFQILFESFNHSLEPTLNSTFVSCQYEPPYTKMLNAWEKSGAKGFHPGDYFKDEFLAELKKVSGNWVYFGHGEGDRLRGYGHLLLSELMANKPSKPLNATLWFTCSTLDEKNGERIALSWFLNKGTYCILSSAKKVKTEENTILGEAWLEIISKPNNLTIGEIIIELINEDPALYQPILNQYQLLGFPWVQMKI